MLDGFVVRLASTRMSPRSRWISAFSSSVRIAGQILLELRDRCVELAGQFQGPTEIAAVPVAFGQVFQALAVMRNRFFDAAMMIEVIGQVDVRDPALRDYTSRCRYRAFRDSRRRAFSGVPRRPAARTAGHPRPWRLLRGRFCPIKVRPAAASAINAMAAWY